MDSNLKAQPLNRVLKQKEVKKKGQYFILREVVAASGKTVTKDNQRKNLHIYGMCPECGETFSGQFMGFDDTKPQALDCPSKSCRLIINLDNYVLSYTGIRKPEDIPLPPLPPVPADVEVPAATTA